MVSVSIKDTYGNGLYASNSSIILQNSFFVMNGKNKSRILFGAAIAIVSSNITMEGKLSFISNSAVCGGAITADSSTISIKGDVMFQNNSASADGGAIATYSSNIAMEGELSFISNSAEYAGAIAADSSTISIKGDVMFQNNSASAEGGAIATHSSNIAMEGELSFISNSAEYAGAIAADSSTISIKGDVMFQNNSASAEGGAIATHLSNIAMEGKLSFISNSAVYGGGIAADSSTISIKGDVMFQNNSVSRYGGAIAILSSNITTEGKLSFISNSAVFAGAIIAVNSSTISIQGDVMFQNNSAQLGGAMFLSDSSCGHLESTFLMFHNNQAVKGGAVYVADSMFYLGDYSSFTGNRAETQGGAISAQNSSVHVQGNVRFFDNNAQLGGSMYLEYNSHIYFSSTTDLIFQNNTAEKGRAIYIRDSTYAASCIHLANDGFFNSVNRCAFGSSSYPFPVLLLNTSMMERGNELFGGFPTFCTDSSYYNDLKKVQSMQNNPPVVSSKPSTWYRFVIIEPLELTVSRGEMFRRPVIARDQFYLPVPATIRAYFTSSNGSTSDLAECQSLQKIGAECTTLNYTVFSAQETVDLYIYAEEGPCGPTESMRITIHLQDCPHVFVLFNNIHCVCEKRLQKFTNSCNIDNRTFKRTPDSNFWVGIEQQNGTYLGLILHPHCPLDYCR